jgi:D-arginine dehydrogenase
MQIAPALAAVGGALLTGAPIPADLAARGVTAAALAPDRPGLSPAG